MFVDSHPLPAAAIRIAAAQSCPVPGGVSANAATVARLVRQAADADARLVVLPEKFLSGYEPALIRSDPERYAVRMDDPRLDPIAAACQDTATAAVVGAAVEHDGQLFISALVFGSDGTLRARYDKQSLFRSERELFQSGTSGCTVELAGWRIGLAICYDAGFPEHARAASRDGCHAYLVGGLFGVGNGYHESRTWMPARALDNTCYTLLANHVGTTGGWHACGASAIWGPDGRLVTQASPDATEVVVADLDPDRLAGARAAHPILADLSEGAARLAPRSQHTLA